MTMYIDETVGLNSEQIEKLINLMDLFHIQCWEKQIDGEHVYEVDFKPITYKNIVYYITMETIKSLVEFLEFKHIEINQNGFIKFVFKPYNYKIWEDIRTLSFRDR